jgi:hypothetical protein
MASTLQTIHTNVGYLVVLVVLVAAAVAYRAAAQPPVSRLSSLTMVLLDLHVTVGIALYVAAGWWDGGALVAYVHPLLGVAALGVGHAGLARARRSGSSRAAAQGLLGTLGLVVAAVFVASV